MLSDATRPAVAPGWRLAAFALILTAGGFAFGLFWRLAGLPPQMHLGVVQPFPMLATGALLVLLGLASTWVPLRWLDRRGLRTVGLGFSAAVPRRLLLGLVGGGLTPALVVAGFLLAGAATVTRTAPDLLSETLPIVGATILVSSWEEIALRGYFMQVIAAMGGPVLAACISGVVFGLIHAGNPGANPTGLAITAATGILLALLVVRTGSLWLACGYHAGWNLVAAIGFGLRDSGMVHRGALAATELHGPAFLTGGSYGFEASIVTGVVEAIVLLVLLWAAPRWALDPESQPYFENKSRQPT